MLRAPKAKSKFSQPDVAHVIEETLAMKIGGQMRDAVIYSFDMRLSATFDELYAVKAVIQQIEAIDLRLKGLTKENVTQFLELMKHLAMHPCIATNGEIRKVITTIPERYFTAALLTAQQSLVPISAGNPGNNYFLVEQRAYDNAYHVINHALMRAGYITPAEHLSSDQHLFTEWQSLMPIVASNPGNMVEQRAYDDAYHVINHALMREGYITHDQYLSSLSNPSEMKEETYESLPKNVYEFIRSVEANDVCSKAWENRFRHYQPRTERNRLSAYFAKKADEIRLLPEHEAIFMTDKIKYFISHLQTRYIQYPWAIAMLSDLVADTHSPRSLPPKILLRVPPRHVPPQKTVLRAYVHDVGELFVRLDEINDLQQFIREYPNIRDHIGTILTKYSAEDKAHVEDKVNILVDLRKRVDDNGIHKKPFATLLIQYLDYCHVRIKTPLPDHLLIKFNTLQLIYEETQIPRQQTKSNFLRTWIEFIRSNPTKSYAECRQLAEIAHPNYIEARPVSMWRFFDMSKHRYSDLVNAVMQAESPVFNPVIETEHTHQRVR